MTGLKPQEVVVGAVVLEQVRAPTLLIVGGRDQQVLELNQQAAARD